MVTQIQPVLNERHQMMCPTTCSWCCYISTSLLEPFGFKCLNSVYLEEKVALTRDMFCTKAYTTHCRNECKTNEL